LKESAVAEEWRILSVTSYEGFEFISSIEHKVYPFYGVQFHPEKNAFEWGIESIPHSAEAILVDQFYGNFFLNEGTFIGRHVDFLSEGKYVKFFFTKQAGRVGNTECQWVTLILVHVVCNTVQLYAHVTGYQGINCV
jgi:hypothetical protein